MIRITRHAEEGGTTTWEIQRRDGEDISSEEEREVLRAIDVVLLNWGLHTQRIDRRSEQTGASA